MLPEYRVTVNDAFAIPEPFHSHSNPKVEDQIKHLVIFGKFIGIYPSNLKFIWIIPALLAMVSIVDWVGLILAPTGKQGHVTAFDICGKIGSPQFFTGGVFYYYYIQTRGKKLVNIFVTWNKIPSIVADKTLTKFTLVALTIIMTSAIFENISFHFMLFPVFETVTTNKSQLEVYYERHHTFWALLVPYTPFQTIVLLIANKFALYAWNYTDILVTVLCRALAFRFQTLSQNISILDPKYSLHQYEKLTDLQMLIQEYLSPLVFTSFYMDFYATCMQLYMWMTPSNHQHFLHTVYLLWSFFHLIGRISFLSYHASSLHESSASIQNCITNTLRSNGNRFGVMPVLLQRQIHRLERPPKRQLAITGLGCFVITKKFMLTLIYVAFSFQIFLTQSDAIKCY